MVNFSFPICTAFEFCKVRLFFIGKYIGFMSRRPFFKCAELKSACIILLMMKKKNIGSSGKIHDVEKILNYFCVTITFIINSENFNVYISNSYARTSLILSKTDRY